MNAVDTWERRMIRLSAEVARGRGGFQGLCANEWQPPHRAARVSLKGAPCMAFAAAPDLTRKIELIGVPLDLGASKRGVRLGPEAIRSQGLRRRIEALGYAAADMGDLAVDQSGP